MALNQPRIQYVEVRNEVLTLLRDNVAILNSGLEIPIIDPTTQIIKGSPIFRPTYTTVYPYILVAYDNKNTEEYQTIGGRKQAIFTLSVYAVVREISDGAYDDNDEVVQLIDNIESIFRDNIQISTKILFNNIPITEFNIPSEDEATYVAGGRSELELKVEVI
jgi:hypothetical protein